MATLLGLAITSLTSKAGILSRKASMRLAAETGKKMVDRTKELGRGLNKAEVEEVFAQTLPEKCRPQIITTKEEIYPFMRNMGVTDEQIAQQISNPAMGAACIPNGAKKQPIYVPLGKFPTDIENSLTAHELEHALERNNRVKNIFLRKYAKFVQNVRKMADNISGTSIAAKYNDKAAKTGLDTQTAQVRLQMENGTFNQYCIDRFNPMEHALTTEATQEGLAKANGLSSVEDLYTKIRESLRLNYSAGDRANSCGRQRFRILHQVLDAERPAYTVESEVERYAFNLGEGQIPKSKGTAILYEIAQKANKAEKIAYYKNKLLGRLKIPNQYTTEKDIYKLFSDKADEQIAKALVKDMNLQQKISLFYAIRNNPQSIRNIKAFLDATKDMSNGGYKNYIDAIINIEPKFLTNPDFMKIAKIQGEDGFPVYINALEYIPKMMSEEQIRAFAQIAETKGLRGVYKYKTLYQCTDSKDFDKLKAFADIEIKGNAEVKGYNPYADIGYTEIPYLPSEKINEFSFRAQEAAKKGEDIMSQLEREASQFLSETRSMTV